MGVWQVAQSEYLKKPWETEPNFAENIVDGYHFLMIRHPQLLSWCGYVGVPQGHTLYRKEYCGYDYDNCPESILRVHGGVTYGGNDIKGMNKKMWYFGFDCAHCSDFVPGQKYSHGEYRDINYVTKELVSLGEQLMELEKKVLN